MEIFMFIQGFFSATALYFQDNNNRTYLHLASNSLTGAASGSLLAPIILSVNNVARQYPISTLLGSILTIGSIPLVLRGVVHLARKTGVGVEKAEFANKNIDKYLDLTFFALQTIMVGLAAPELMRGNLFEKAVIFPAAILMPGLTIALVREKHYSNYQITSLITSLRENGG
jgi:hypothetical protein